MPRIWDKLYGGYYLEYRMVSVDVSTELLNIARVHYKIITKFTNTFTETQYIAVSFRVFFYHSDLIIFSRSRDF